MRMSVSFLGSLRIHPPAGIALARFGNTFAKGVLRRASKSGKIFVNGFCPSLEYFECVAE
jgi:hypothetical protein